MFKNIQEYQNQSGTNIQELSKLLDNSRIGRMKNAKWDLGVIGLLSWLKTGELLERLLKRPRELFSIIKYKKPLPKINDPGTSWTRSKSIIF